MFPSGILSGSRSLMEMFVGLLHRLRAITDEHGGAFESDGFRRFFATIRGELDNVFFTEAEEHLAELKLRDGVLISAGLGPGNVGVGYVLRKPFRGGSWWKRIFQRRPTTFTFFIDPRDMAGAKALSDLEDQGVNLAANAVAHSADHVDSFLKMLRVELAFYIGCLNLRERLGGLGEETAFPEPAAASERDHTFRGLYDICLALTMNRKVVGNDADADGRNLAVVTGANQGGKSTFLRSVGQAQLMMQCGMFVGAEALRANVCRGLFTHYRRREDPSMKSGKFDEELGRMSAIADGLSPDAMVLFNESFAATNEREGSEIARQIVGALLERRIKVFFVTHLYTFARGLFEERSGDAVFLRALRTAGAGRTYKLTVGEPLATSYGEDVFDEVFAVDKADAGG
jgi:DNA mismatch repair ATPase MutS